MLRAGWTQDQFREEVNLTQGRVVVRGKIASRIKNRDKKGGPKRADYVLYGKPNIALAALEAKRNKYPLGTGMGQALRYAEMLDAPFAISSNGNAFLIHDRTGEGADGASCFALIEQVNAKKKLKEMIDYDAEFSSVAEACIRKNACEPICASVFGH